MTIRTEQLPRVLELPWPPKELTPNARRRNHWRVTQRHAKAYRTLCFVLASNRLPVLDCGVITGITFYPPDRRKRDDDGMIGAFKAGRDGVADALGCDDHAFRPTYKFGDPVKGGKIVCEIGAPCRAEIARAA